MREIVYGVVESLHLNSFQIVCLGNSVIEGNASPETLFSGMGLIITAVILTFISRQSSDGGMPCKLSCITP